MSSTLFLSADSHVLEPGDLWLKEAKASDRDRVPRVVTENGKSRVEGEGLGNRPLSLTFAAGKRGEQMDYNSTAYEHRPVAGYDLNARLEAQEQDGVAGEIMYPTLALNAYNLSDPVLKRECLRIYNRWLTDMARRSNGRLLAVGLLAIDDPARIEADMRELMDWGCAAVQPPTFVDTPYNNPQYEPLWKTAEDMDIPVVFHIGGGGRLIKVQGPGAGMINYFGVIECVQNLLMTMIWAGVFAAHPRLRVGYVEAGIGWIPPLLQRMDDVWEQHRSWIKPRLDKAPSEYYREQCHATFERDELGLRMRHDVGVQTLMWATDYPHAESSWPESRRIADEEFKAIPAEERNRIVAGNVAEVYRWNLPHSGDRKAA